MIRKILLHPNPILKTKTEPVEKIDGPIYDLISDMIDTMYAEQGYGVAANQVGVSKSIFVMDIDWVSGPKNPKIFINPVILQLDELKKFEEGCLSIPGVFTDTMRYNKVKLQWTTPEGTTNEEEFTGLAALAIQHEMDHLAGKLFIDDMGPMKKQLLLNKSRKLKKRMF